MPRFKSKHIPELDIDVLFGDAFIIRAGERGIMVTQFKVPAACSFVRMSLWQNDRKFQDWLTAFKELMEILKR